MPDSEPSGQTPTHAPHPSPVDGDEWSSSWSRPAVPGQSARSSWAASTATVSALMFTSTSYGPGPTKPAPSTGWLRPCETTSQCATSTPQSRRKWSNRAPPTRRTTRSRRAAGLSRPLTGSGSRLFLTQGHQQRKARSVHVTKGLTRARVVVGRPGAPSRTPDRRPPPLLTRPPRPCRRGISQLGLSVRSTTQTPTPVAISAPVATACAPGGIWAARSRQHMGSRRAGVRTV